ncbi:hypothetical protein HK100_000120 [Physocladia obscura]|uniref:Uncharacterized protein n=1 Tax=Physocladia obscura TaxID=109957 RepID=A0AAD5SYY0_9FUNG|nr:hypothetical protein HK100_000120 [Physocladia obscura]
MDDAFARIESSFKICRIKQDAFIGNEDEILGNPFNATRKRRRGIIREEVKPFKANRRTVAQMDEICKEDRDICTTINESEGYVGGEDKFADFKDDGDALAEEVTCDNSIHDNVCQASESSKYRLLVLKLERSKSLILQQRGRHLTEKMLSNCYDHDLLNEIGNSQAAASCPFASEKKFGLNTALLELLWREDAAYKKMFRKLSGLIDENLVRSLESVEESVAEELDTVNLNTESVQFNLGDASSNPGNGGKGSLLSDYSAVVQGPLAIPAFMVEFEVRRTGAHKGDVCLISEAAFEYHQFLSQLDIDIDKLKDVRFYIGYASDGSITIDEIHPEFVSDSNMVFYRVSSNISTFNLLSGDSDTQIFETLQLLKFIKTVIIPAGHTLQDLMMNKSCNGNISEYLPSLPSEGVKAIARKTLYIPKK